MNLQVPATKIVVAVNLEHDEHISITKAKLLAANINAELHLLVTVYDSVTQYADFLPTNIYDAIENELVIKAEKTLDRICDKLHQEGFMALPHVRWCQSIAAALDDLTMILQPRYVIKSVSNDQDLANPLATAQDRYCIKHSRASLLLSRHDKLNYQHIAVALDTVTTDPQHIALNHQLIEEAKRLSTINDAKVSLLNVYELPFQHIDLEIDDYLTADLRNDIAQHHNNKMLEYVNAHNLPLDTFHIFNGHAGETLGAFVEGHGVDLFVMGTAMRDDFNCIFLGNVAEDMLVRINCEILCIPMVKDGILSHIDDIDDFENYDDFTGKYY